MKISVFQIESSIFRSCFTMNNLDILEVDMRYYELHGRPKKSAKKGENGKADYSTNIAAIHMKYSS